MSFRPRRSALYLPASNQKAIDKARTLDCDAVILDLEDAVAPDMKGVARDQAVAAIRAGGWGGRELIVRVNGLDTSWGVEDVRALVEAAPDVLLAPKVSSGNDVRAYDRLIGAQSPVGLWVMIETARAMFRLDDIAAASEGGHLTGFVMGTNDLAKEMAARLDVERRPFLGFLAQSVAAARGWGLAILDGVYNALEDDDGLARQCAQAVEFGFDGKTLIHPRQIGICNVAFTPDTAAVSEARKVVEAFDLPENADKGAIRLDGRMVERLHLAQAQRTLAMAAAR